MAFPQNAPPNISAPLAVVLVDPATGLTYAGVATAAGSVGVAKATSIGAVGDSLVGLGWPNFDLNNGGSPPTSTQINAAYTTGVKYMTLRNPLFHASMRSNGGYFPFEFAGYCGGATSQQIVGQNVGTGVGWQGVSPLDVMLANPYGLPRMCIVLAGTNDWGNGLTPAQSCSALLFAYNKLIAAGVVPIAMTIPPGAAYPTTMTGTITGITQAAQAVVTINTVSTTNPFVGLATVENVFVTGASGMTQINGKVVKVVATGGVSGAWTVTLNINSSAFTAWSSGGTLTLYPRTTWVRQFNQQLIRQAKNLQIPCADIYSALADPSSGRYRTTASLTISGISVASSAVVTVNTVSTANPMSLGGGVYFSGVSGMTQINGLTGTITSLGGSSGAWTATTSINSSGFSAWTSGGTAAYSSYTIDNIHWAATGAAVIGDVLNQTVSGWFTGGPPLFAAGLDDTTTPSDPADGFPNVRIADPYGLAVTGTVNSSSSSFTDWVAPTTAAMGTVYNSSGNEPGGGHTMWRSSGSVAGQTPNYLGNAFCVVGDGTHTTGAMGYNVSPFQIPSNTGDKIAFFFRIKHLPSGAIAAAQDDFQVGALNGSNGHKLCGIMGPSITGAFDTCQIGGEPGYDAGLAYFEYTMVAAEVNFAPFFVLQNTASSASNTGNALCITPPQCINLTQDGTIV